MVTTRTSLLLDQFLPSCSHCVWDSALLEVNTALYSSWILALIWDWFIE